MAVARTSRSTRQGHLVAGGLERISDWLPPKSRSRLQRTAYRCRVVADQRLRGELLERQDADQQARVNAAGGRWSDEERRRCREVDAANTAWLAAVVTSRGWPGRSLVGDDGAQAAWLLGQVRHEAPFLRVG
jgi:hypothetical protein